MTSSFLHHPLIFFLLGFQFSFHCHTGSVPKLSELPSCLVFKQALLWQMTDVLNRLKVTVEVLSSEFYHWQTVYINPFSNCVCPSVWSRLSGHSHRMRFYVSSVLLYNSYSVYICRLTADISWKVFDIHVCMFTHAKKK